MINTRQRIQKNHGRKITHLGGRNLSIGLEMFLESLVVDSIVQVLDVQIYSLVTLHALNLK